MTTSVYENVPRFRTSSDVATFLAGKKIKAWKIL